jgi:hypothetical protein
VSIKHKRRLIFIAYHYNPFASLDFAEEGIIGGGRKIRQFGSSVGYRKPKNALWIKDLTFFTNRNIIEIEKVARADPFEPAHLAASFDVASD